MLVQTRHGDWEKRIMRFLEDEADRPFVRGRNDCAMFVDAAIEAQTGVSPARAYRGTYDDEAGARAIILGHGGWVPFISHILDTPPLASPLLAQRGDVALWRGPLTGEENLGLWLGDCIAAKTDVGWEEIPGQYMIQAWPVGRVPLDG